MSKAATKTPPKGPHVQVNISTWTKDSHGLYDYQAQEDAYRKQTHYIKSSCKIYKDNYKPDTIFDSNGKHQDNNNNSLVAEVVIDKSKGAPEFKLKCHVKKQNEIQNQALNFYRTPYLVVREFSKNGINNGYPLHPGNVIKLGRVQYMVIESKNEAQTSTLRSTNHFEQTNGVFDVQKHLTEHDKALEQGQGSCKVCLCSQETEGDPLISPCNCKGSCRMIHVGCLKTWINSKVKKQIKGIAQSYNFTKFECQICKCPFPQIVRYNAKDVQMMTITKPNKPYIILQSINNKQQSKQQRCLHLISTEQNNSIKIGRGHECQIRITDISVSRKHAEIQLKDGDFYIADTKAKFGTLIKLEQDFILQANRTIRIQFARTVFQFKVKADPVEDVDTE